MASVQLDRLAVVNSSTAIKVPCRVATTGSDINSLLTPAGSQLGGGGGGLITIDGVPLNAGDRVLVKDQANQTTNGIYIAMAGPWVLDIDFNTAAVCHGTLVNVTDGATQAGEWFQITTPNPVVVGSSNITFGITSSPTISAAMSPVVGAATLAAAQTAFGLAAADGSTFTDFPGLTGIRHAKTATYLVAAADQGATIALGGNNFYALDFGAPSGYSASFMTLVVNEDTARAKSIVLSGGPTFKLYPGQSCVVFNQNNVWQTLGAPARWRVSGVVFYVDPVNGLDTSDGLATSGSGAFATIQQAVNTVHTDIDALSFPTIQLLDGNHPAGAGVNLNYAQVGGNQILIQGHPGAPQNVEVYCTGGGSCFIARDGGATYTLSGMTLATSGSGSVALNVSQNAVVDLNGVNFDAFVGGTHISVSTWASVNILASYEIVGAASTHVTVSNNAYLNYGTFTITGGSSLAFNTFLECTTCGIVSDGGVAPTFTGFSGVTGTRYSVSYNGVVISGIAGNYPGNTAGSTSTGGQIS